MQRIAIQASYFTDIRSPKCHEITQNNAVTIHAYDALQKQQIQSYTKAFDTSKPPQNDNVDANGLRRPMDYATTKPPSESIPSNQHILDLTLAPKHFAVIICVVESIELLKLGEPHKRCLWTCNEGNWTRKWLVP